MKNKLTLVRPTIVHEQGTPFRIMLDDLTTARVIEVADLCHSTPENVINAIVRDVMEDDALAHGDEPNFH